MGSRPGVGSSRDDFRLKASLEQGRRVFAGHRREVAGEFGFDAVGHHGDGIVPHDLAIVVRRGDLLVCSTSRECRTFSPTL